MIFVGDIAIPEKNCLSFSQLPDGLKNKQWFGNLEGGIVSDKVSGDLIKEYCLFNNENALDDVLREFNFVGFSLANNHIDDFGAIQLTQQKLDNRGLVYTGAGINLEIASKEIVLQEEDNQIVIISFGWEIIGCSTATDVKPGTNPLIRDYVLDEIIRINNKYIGYKKVVFFHWNYELELYPLPHHRELARIIIEHGFDAVIGCHSHRIQGIEVYKGKPIVYGLGNWVLPTKKFWNGTLSYPKFCNYQLAFEFNFKKNEFYCYTFRHRPESQEIIFDRKMPIRDFNEYFYLGPFLDKSDENYRYWFKKNRIKKKLLPIFYLNDSRVNYTLKRIWIKVRHFAIVKILKPFFKT